ncbi:MAG: D-sedoheptulose 7-phosphate isomerase [Candidatus Omnitrophota bacterium]|nr:MAG: D-sedoheptulose 7-phosphate isomerase [Candidatus Omnitrophota bacterium]
MDQIISNSIKNCKQALAALEANQETIKKIASLCIWTLQNKGKIILMGNGGRAADAQHLAAEFVGRFKMDRAALPALALSINTSILTAVGNDYGFDEVFARQISALANPEDIVVGISTSGNSKNVIKAIKKAKEKGIKTVGFLGKDGGELKKLVDVALVIASADTPRIQEMHILSGHIICEIVEKALAQK